MRELIAPLAFVECSIGILTDAFTVEKVVDPLALVLCTVFMEVSPMALSFTHAPVPEVVRLVCLLAETKAILLLICHFTDVDGTLLGDNHRCAILRIEKKDFNLVWQTFILQQFVNAWSII